MKTFKNIAAQGDCLLIRIDTIPKSATKAKPENGYFVVAHSETGHNHVVEANAAQMFIDQTNEFIAYVQTLDGVELKHLRDFDTHESLYLEPGNYEIRRQREYTLEGYRRAAD